MKGPAGFEEFAHGDADEVGATLLALERATSSVRPEAMATFIYGGSAALNKHRWLVRFIEEDPVFDREVRAGRGGFLGE
jgi:hypothetical protein